MTVIVRCPNPECGLQLHVPESYLGKNGRCQQCKRTFVITPAEITPPEKKAEKPRVQAEAARTSIGRFQIRTRLGAGAFGTVYRAHDPQLDREVAVKVPQAAVLDSPRRVERFLREARAAAALRHPNIVPVFEAGQVDGVHYIASAFIEGEPLSESVRDKGMDPTRAARIVQALAEALAYAHQLGVVHRDVKPANVMLDTKDLPHLMDFGLAARMESTEKLTHDGAVLGTPSYMAPEQARGQDGEAKPESDQYSLGVVLYELLTGRTPFEGPPQIVLFNVIHQEPPSPRKLKKEIPQDLETICLKAMAKDPRDRYAGCQSFANDLRRWLEGEPIRARPLGIRERLVRWVRREPRLAASAACLFVSLLVLSLALFVRVGQLVTEVIRERDATALERAEKETTQEALDAEKLAREKADQDRDQDRLALASQKVEVNHLTDVPALLDDCAPGGRGWEWRHLRLRATGGGVQLLPGHYRGVAGLAFTPNNQRAVCLSPDGVVRFWDVLSGKMVHQTRLSGIDWNTKMVLSTDGSRVVACRTPAPTWYAIDPHLGLSLVGLAATPQWGPLLAATNLALGRRVPLPPYQTPEQVNDVIVWDALTGAELANWKTSAGRAVELSVDESGTRIALAVGNWNQTSQVKVYHWAKGRLIAALEKTFDSPRLILSPDGERLVTLSGKLGQPPEAKVWDVNQAKELYTLDDKQGAIEQVVFSPNSKRIAVYAGGSANRTVTVKKPVTATESYTVNVTTPDGKVIPEQKTRTVTKYVEETMMLSESTESVPRIRLVDAEDGRERLVLNEPGPAYGMAFSHDGTRLATTGPNLCIPDSEVKLWDLERGVRVLTVKSPASGILTLVAFSLDGKHLVAGAQGNPTATLWSATDGSLLRAYDRHGGPVCSVVYSEDGTQLSSYSTCEQTARVWLAVSGKDRLTLRGTRAALRWGKAGELLSNGFGLAWATSSSSTYDPSRCGGGCTTQELSVVTNPFTVRAWQQSDVQRSELPAASGRMIALSVAGNLATCIPQQSAVPGGTAEIELWDRTNEKRLGVLSGSTSNMLVEFSPDGKLVVGFSSENSTVTEQVPVIKTKKQDGKEVQYTEYYSVFKMVVKRQLKVWDTQSRKVVLQQDDATGRFVFSLDGGLLAFGKGNGVVVWDAKNATIRYTLEMPAAPCQLRFSADARTLVAFSPEATVPRMVTQCAMKDELRSTKVKKTRTENGKPVEVEETVTTTVKVPYTYMVCIPESTPRTLRAWNMAKGNTLFTDATSTGIFAIHPDGTGLLAVKGPVATPSMPPPMPSSPSPVTPGPIPAPAAMPQPLPPSAPVAVSAAQTMPPSTAPVVSVPSPMPSPRPAVPVLQPGLTLWNLTTGASEWTIDYPGMDVTSLAYSPSGKQVAIGATGWVGARRDLCTAPPAVVLLLDTTTRKEFASFRGHSGDILCLAWRPDGAHLASGGADATVKIWRVTRQDATESIPEKRSEGPAK